MKKIIIAAIILCLQNVAAQDKEVKIVIETFFEGLHKADTTKIKTVCSNNMLLQTIAVKPDGNKLLTEDPAEFYISVSRIPKDLRIEERLLSYKIQYDSAMAQVWAPYEFYVNGKLSHSGINSFTLYKVGDKWKIVHIIDTRTLATTN